MSEYNIETILFYQLVIARLGEKELMNWWNTDIAYELGGATFLNDLLGSSIAPLAAAEGLLTAAKNRESALRKDMPHSMSVFSLFHAEPEMQTRIREQLRHYKKYPEDVTDSIVQLMNPKMELSVEDLKSLFTVNREMKFSRTSFGHQVKNPENYSVVELYGGLCQKIILSTKNQYEYCYYQVEQ